MPTQKTKNPICRSKKPDLELTLPWPPSIWRLYTKGYHPTKACREYRQIVGYEFLQNRGEWEIITGQCRVEMVVHPGNRRVRDLDNVLKAPLDALTECGVWADDSLKHIESLRVERGPMRSPSQIVIRIWRTCDIPWTETLINK